jgi:CheY-like chemotaxis protein
MRDFDGIEILLVDRDESYAAFASRVIAKTNAGNKLFWAKEDKRTQPVPVVVMTASNQGGDVDECYRLGVNAYIIKPSGFTELTEVIASVRCFWLLVNQVPQ